MEEKTYKNSLNFVPVDVAKGLDRNTGLMVNADDIDPNYERTPKCMHCKNFKCDEEKISLGICSQSEADQEWVAYPDMCAVTCEMYREN